MKTRNVDHVDDHEEDATHINGTKNGYVDDKQHLLEDNSVTLQPINCRTRCLGPARHRLITIEPAMAFFIIAYGTMINLRGQYIRQQVAKEYGIDGDPGQASCNGTDLNNTNSKLMAEVSDWSMYCSVAESIPAFFVVPILGAWSDQIGRKMVMLIPLVGYLIVCLLLILIVALGLDLYMFVIVSLLQGLTGGVGLFFAVSLSYIADITTKEKRLFRIVIIDMIFLLGAGVSQVGIGYFLKYEGYIPPMLMAECFVVLAFFYVITPPFVAETIQKRSTSETSRNPKREMLKNMVAMFKDNSNFRRPKLGILFAANLMIAIVISGGGIISLEALYGMGEPFCWSAVTVGYFTALDLGANAIGALFGGYLLGKCLQDIYIALLSILDTVLSLIFVATAQSSIFIFISSPVGMLRILSSPVIKTVASKLVTDKEQGAMFACMGSIQALGSLLTPIMLNGVYSATVGFYSPFVFYYLIGLLIVPLFLLCLLQVVIQATASKEPTNLTTPVSDEETVPNIN
ncbi:lysosomal proton-coupled steroid conjugate and bile acid symporter SLC46A3-like [Amphiura filiformis]|uniref:lysosomal proton-coupled steroid conjugate and bile acid symporter SLC46A3-like n=1 Tax=Amphiura filiformis TaxID=82378 RepID=UPI003B218D1E